MNRISKYGIAVAAAVAVAIPLAGCGGTGTSYSGTPQAPQQKYSGILIEKVQNMIEQGAAKQGLMLDRVECIETGDTTGECLGYAGAGDTPNSSFSVTCSGKTGMCIWKQELS